jgi:hypothetical protein
MEEEFRRRRSTSPFGGFDFGFGERDQQTLESKTLGRDRAARLVVKADGVRLTILEKGEGDSWKDGTVLEAANLEDLRKKLDERPDLRDDPDVATVLRQASSAKRLRMPEFRWDSSPDLESLFRGFRSGPQSKVVLNGVQIEQTPGHVKVTVTEDGPDGKPVAKTYEGADLDTIKREHPELESRLGGLRIEVGRGPLGGGFGNDWLRRLRRREPRPETTEPGEGLRPDRPSEDGGERHDGRDDDEEMDDDASDETGPFGLQIAPVEDVLREHLGLAAGTGAKVRLVRPDSAAAQLGLKPGDILVGVEGPNGKVENADADAIAGALRGSEKGGALSVDVIRAGRPLKLSR